MHPALPDFPLPLLLETGMDAVALDVRRRLSALNAPRPSSNEVQVGDPCSVVASFGDSGAGFVVVVTASLISTIVEWCSSQRQRYMPIIYCPEDLSPTSGQAQFALCLFDKSLRIWAASINEVSLSASNANKCFVDLLRDHLPSELYTHDHPLESLNLGDTIPLKPDMFDENWLDEFESRERPVPAPFVLDGQSSQEDPGSAVAQILMHPPTPSSWANMLSPISPFSEDSLSPGSPFLLSPISSPGSVMTNSPGYLESNSGRYDASLNFILNDIPMQSTVSPRDICPGLGLIGIDECMDMDRGFPPSTTVVDASLSDVLFIQTKEATDSPFSGCSNLSPSQSQEQNLQPRADDMHPLVFYPSPHASSSSASLSPAPSTSSHAENTHLRVSARRQRGVSQPAIPSQRCSSRMRVSYIHSPNNRRGRPTSDDDEYSPFPRTITPGARKAASDQCDETLSLEKKIKKASRASTGRQFLSPGSKKEFDRATKYPKKYKCPHCKKAFTRGTDVTRHLLTCQVNPEREQKVACHYCGGEAPIRGDSAKRHWLSDACHFAALDRGITPYPRGGE